MTQPTAMVTAFLAWSLLAFPTGYSKSDNTAEAEQAVRWGAEYLLKLFRPTVGSTYAGGATIIYQVSLSVCGYMRICRYGANTVRLSAFLSVHDNHDIPDEPQCIKLCTHVLFKCKHY